MELMTMNDKRYVSRVQMGAKALEWRLKALENVEKWGLQDIESIMLATQEELGEFVQAYHEDTYENADGEPLDEQQPLSECTDEKLDRIEEELADTAALLFQAQAAIDRVR